MPPQIQTFANGLTVTQLKQLLATWPEVDDSGNPLEVWMCTSTNTSSPVTQVWPLNVRTDGADILFATDSNETIDIMRTVT